MICKNHGCLKGILRVSRKEIMLSDVNPDTLNAWCSSLQMFDDVIVQLRKGAVPMLFVATMFADFAEADSESQVLSLLFMRLLARV